MRYSLCIALCLLAHPLVRADEKAKTPYDGSWFKAMRYRPIGPFRGGRSAAVCGVPGKPRLFYFGGAGGGVWKTTTGGDTWKNISDGQFGGSIGAVAVSTYDPNVIYVGGGEVTMRGNVSHGYGMWKSTDAGKTWKHIGLDDTRHIPRIRIHPRNPEVVYVAALGHLFGPNQQRGVFRSKDGGNTWKKVLFVNNEVGAVDLILDPSNPRIIYASTWRIKRTPYSLESGGEGCGLWKSTDGGDSWTEITRNKGLPEGTIGIIGVAVSPVNSDRVWAIIEAKEGGVFRSEDAGKTWKRINQDNTLRQRAWYYTRIYAGPKNIDEVYVLNVRYWRSGDGGKSFSRIGTPHVDHHDMWIDPQEPDRIIVGDDGGAQVTFDRGKNWTTYHNQPTSQFYRVTTDNHFPYHILGAQQDNSTVRILHRSGRSTITEREWEPTAGGESGHLAPNPKDSDIVYGGSYAGYLTRFNHRTREIRNVTVWPNDPIGQGADKQKYRFQWNFPIFFSPHDTKTLYSAANVLFRSTDEGQSWTPISPDLTRNDKSKQRSSGGPITQDNTTVEYYCTIFAALESPHEKGLIWCGSDDGLVHISRDGGKNWANVTPKDLPEWTMINSIEAHPTIKGGLYLAGTRYKLDDFKPYLYMTTDYGKTWTKIVQGIDSTHFTRVVRADQHRPGLLYAGTESGMYVSFDDGEHWQSLQLNLPTVPITDLAVKDNDLVVATQGRSFWVLDDLTPLQQIQPGLMKKTLHSFTPRHTYRLRGGTTKNSPLLAGQNPPTGVVFYYHLEEKPTKDQPLVFEIQDAEGEWIRRFRSDAEEDGDRIEAEAGMNRFEWNMRYPSAEGFEGMVLWAGGLEGPRAVPGKYQAKFTFGKHSGKVSFEIRKDPRAAASPEDFLAQLQFLLATQTKLGEVTETIGEIRDLRDQLENIQERLKDEKEFKSVVNQAEKLVKKITAIEEALYQTKNKSPQDPLNFPVRLTNKLAALSRTAGLGDNRPTDQALEVRKVLFKLIDTELAALSLVKEKDLPAFNELLIEKKVTPVFPPVDKESMP